MIITIAGYGFVGQAHEHVLKRKFKVNVYDPAKGYHNFVQGDGVVVCVSTPPAEDGSCCVDNVIDVLNLTPDNIPILIKSTISLEGWKLIKSQFPKHQLAFSPEYLRAATAIEDFEKNRLIYMGGDEIGFWHAVFRVAYDDPQFTTSIASPEELILAKYFENSFLATKVAFFNQIYDLCKAADIDYDVVSRVLGNDFRIGHSHTRVTKERGFGGHCFPKDTSAIIKTSEMFDIDLSILKSAVEYNKKIRNEK
jgi:UDPglucose 6-dehydrogenase